MIRINDQCWVEPGDIVGVSVGDHGAVTVHSACLGALEAKREYGEGVYACAERFVAAIREAKQPPAVLEAIDGLAQSVDDFMVQMAEQHGKIVAKLGE